MVMVEGTKIDHGEPDAGRVVPLPATLGGRELLFTTPTGRMWRERNFYRDLWRPAQEASGQDIRPHECRHSYVSHLRASGINDADLAEIVGHRVETMLALYIHPVGDGFRAVRDAVGQQQGHSRSWPESGISEFSIEKL